MTDEECEKIYLENEKLALKFGSQKQILHDDDLMQKIKIALWRAIKSYDKSKGYAFSTYAYRVMNNEYIYSFRDKYNKFEFVDNVIYTENGCIDILDTIPAENIDIDKELDNKKMIKLIYDFLDTLGPDIKNMYIDYYIEGKSKSEISNIYKIPTKKLTNTFGYINNCLQNLLKEYK